MTQYEDAKKEDDAGNRKFIEAQHMVNDAPDRAIEYFYCAAQHYKKSYVLHPTLFYSNLDRSKKIIEYANQHKSNISHTAHSLDDAPLDIEPYIVDNSILIEGFDSVAGMHELKEELNNELIVQLVEFDNWLKYHPYHEEQTGGFLLYGPPGCGKTFIGKAIIAEIRKKGIHMTALQVSPSELLGKYVGDSEKNISKIFNYAKDNSPTIMIFDEFHSLTNKNGESGHDSRVINTLLTEMDKLKTSKRVWIIATTNYPWRIEKAMIRAGRINKHILVPPPDVNARRELFKMYLNKRPIVANLLSDLMLDTFVEKTEGYSSADIFEITHVAANASMKLNELIDDDVVEDSMKNTPLSAISWCIDVIAEFSLNPMLSKTYGDVHELCKKMISDSEKSNLINQKVK